MMIDGLLFNGGRNWVCNGAVFSMGTNVYSFGGVNVDIYLREVLEPEVLSCPLCDIIVFL